MKLVFLTSINPHAKRKYLFYRYKYLINFFNKKENKLYYITFGNHFKIQKHKNFYIITIRHTPVLRFFILFSFLFHIRSKYLFTDSHEYYLPCAVLFITSILKMKYFYEILDLIEINSITTNYFKRNSIQAKLIKIFAFMLYKKASRLYVMHKEFKKYLVSIGIEREKVKIIHYGSNLFQKIPNSTELLELKKNLNLAQEKVLGWFGYFAPHKGILEQLIPAMNLISKEISDCKLLLIGDGPIKNAIQRKIQDLNLKNKVILLNWVDYEKISLYYLISDIILITASITDSERYIMPIKLYDALYLGRCVIITESPSLSDLFIEKKHLLYCKPGDPYDLAIKVINALHDSDLIERISKEGKNFAHNYFDLKKNTEKLALDIYSHI